VIRGLRFLGVLFLVTQNLPRTQRIGLARRNHKAAARSGCELPARRWRRARREGGGTHYKRETN
jgi:hypothetical protein